MDDFVQFRAAVDVQRDGIGRVPEQGLRFSEIKALDAHAIEFGFRVFQWQREAGQVIP
nr:hypothetical protein [Ralstonia mannitolilytica]